MPTTTRQTASLRAALPLPGDVRVDHDASTIYGASVMVIGPAVGHGFELDATSLQQLVDVVNANGGSVKVRATHPKVDGEGQSEDDLFMEVGTITNLRVDGDRVRGDVHLEDYAAVVPGRGDVRTYLLRRAEKHPERLGLSAVIGFDIEPVQDGDTVRLCARIDEVQAIDFVGRGAATPDGLLSQKQPKADTSSALTPTNNNAGVTTPARKPALRQGKVKMEYDPKYDEELRALGLGDDADEEEKKAFFNDLTDEQKTELKAKLEAVEEEEEEEKPKETAAKLAAKQKQRRDVIIIDGADKLLAAEGKRVTQLAQLGKTLRVSDEIVDRAIADGDTVIEARDRFLTHLRDKTKKRPNGGNGGVIEVGENKAVASLRVAIPEAIQLRSGRTIAKPHELAAGLASLSLLDMFRRYLVALGVGHDQVYGYGRTKLADLLGPRRFRQEFPQFASLAQSTSDFDNILENTMRKTLRDEYKEYSKTWNRWAQRATTPDFKPVSRPQLSQSPDLQPRDEGGEIRYARVTDSKETYTVREYVSGIRLTRQAIINDDLSAFNRLPRIQGQAAARLEDQLAYNVLNRNLVMSDTNALFHSTHANLVTGTGKVGLPTTVSVLDETNKLLRKQTGLGGVGKLNLSAKYLLVPTALEIAAQQFISSTVDPSKQNQVPNPFAGKLEVIATPFLDAGNAIPGSASTTGSNTAWYIVSDQIENVEVCFLSDEPEPVLRQETDFDTEDVKFAVRHTAGAAAIEYRGLVKNPGS